MKKNPSRFKMNRRCAIVLTATSILCSVASELTCGVGHVLSEERSVTIHTERDEYGEWVTTISTYQDSESSANSTNLDVKRSVIICGGKQIVHIKATIRGSSQNASVSSSGETLLFQQKGGKNAVVTNNRRTVYRKNEEAEEGFGGILTNRHLQPNELFEVRLDRKITKWNRSVGIGVTPYSPSDVEYPDWMKSGASMMYNKEVYENGVATKNNYGKDLKGLLAGERVGVMKRDNGNVQFFINGVDQGIALSKIPYPVYGVFDPFANTVQGTIIYDGLPLPS